MADLALFDLTEIGRALVLSPHDDDAAIGCGGLIQALPETAAVIVMTDGRLGYRTLAKKETVVGTRRREALESYGRLGLTPEGVCFLDFPDMSLRNFQCWTTLDGREGAYQRVFRLLRERRVETVFIPSHRDVHPDHKATADIGQVAAFQARETLMPDYGPPAPIRRVLAYQVWEPLRRPTHSHLLDPQASDAKRRALGAYASQAAVLDELESRGTLSFEEERFALVAEWP